MIRAAAAILLGLIFLAPLPAAAQTTALGRADTALSNITLPTALNNLGLGTTASPAFGGLTIQGFADFYPIGTTPDNGYHGSVRITQPAVSGQYINMVRQSSFAWSIGNTYNTNNFAIGQGQTIDSNFTNPFFTITPQGTTTVNVAGVTQHALVGQNNTGSTAPTTNLDSVYGFTTLAHASAGANNQAPHFYIGGSFGAQAAVSDNGYGQTTLSATASGGATSVQIAGSITGIQNGDAIFIALDNGNLFSTLVNGIPAGSTVPISPALPSQASTGNAFYDYEGQIQAAITNGILENSATNFLGNEGFEAGISTRAGSSVFFKCIICAAANSDDAVAADGPWDMVMGMSMQGGAVGSKVGLGIGPWSGAQPIQTTGTIIKTFGSGTVANGIDLTSYTITGNSLALPGGVTVTGAGAATVKTVRVTPTTVASLPTCNAGAEGTHAAVTDDSTAVSWGAAVTGGGTSHVAVYCDGTSWKVYAQ